MAVTHREPGGALRRIEIDRPFCRLLHFERMFCHMPRRLRSFRIMSESFVIATPAA